MWKKDEDFAPAPPPAAPAPAPAAAPAAPPPSEPRRERAAIGASISVVGDLSGEEDLVVHGRVEGKIELNQYAVTIGKTGRVKADVYGKMIVVEGEVEGNLHAGEQILIRKSGVVRGNLSAARVTLEDGCRFKGSIDMESPQASERVKPAPMRAAEPAPKPAAAPAAATPAPNRPEIARV
jgi:cytoskeletal protein CcmA (bactofilin family)